MARVPQSRNVVGFNPTAPARVRPDTGAAEGFEAASKMLSAQSEVEFQLQDRKAVADAKFADTAFNDSVRDILHNAENGFMHSRGGDTLSRHEDATNRLNEALKTSLDGLDDRARKKAAPSLNERLSRAVQQIDTHKIGQNRVYQEDAADARLQSLKNTALTDDEAFLPSLQTSITELRDRGARAGWAPEVLKQEVQKKKDEFYSERFLAISDPEGAFHEFTAAKGTISNKLYNRLKPKMERAANIAIGRRLGEEAYSKAIQPLDWVKYDNQNAVRDDPLSNKLTSALSFLPQMGIKMEVFSGGQAPKGTPGEKRVGSTRHDDGHAADVFFYKDGKQLSWRNADDIPVFQEIVRRAKAAGVTGFGAGEGYMRPGSMHIGFGNPAVWGDNGKGANAPQWLRDAFNNTEKLERLPGLPASVRAHNLAKITNRDQRAAAMAEYNQLQSFDAGSLKQIENAIGQIKKGVNVPQEQLDEIVELANNPENEILLSRVAEAEALSQVQQQALIMRPDELDERIRLANAEMQEKVFSYGLDQQLQVLKGVRKTMGEEVQNDPLAWADRVGLIEFKPLEFDPSDPEAFANSLRIRAANVATVREHYQFEALGGGENVSWRPHEAAGFNRLLAKDPSFLPTFASQVVSAFGNDAPKAFAQISIDAPAIAHVSGLTQAVGNNRIASEVGQILFEKSQEGYVSPITNKRALSRQVDAFLGGSLDRHPSTRDRASHTARLLFEGRVRGLDIDLSRLGEEGSEVQDILERAINDSLGATFVDGEQYGGLVKINGHQTYVPTNFSAERLERLFTGLDDELLESHPEIFDPDNIGHRASRIRRGRLVVTNKDGKYRVDLSVPGSGQPEYLIQEDGADWVLDVARLQEAAVQRDIQALRRFDSYSSFGLGMYERPNFDQGGVE